MNTKIDKGQATRQHVVTIATRLFAKSGYDGTSIEDVLAETELSRGALYYHFASKEKLFEAVLEALEADIAETLRNASAGLTDPAEGLRAGCDAFLKLASNATVRQIVLVDAPAVVGWQKWREIDARHGFGMMKLSLQAAAAQGRVRADLVDVFAHMLLAAMFETALIISRSDNPKAAARTGRTAVKELISKLVPE